LFNEGFVINVALPLHGQLRVTTDYCFADTLNHDVAVPAGNVVVGSRFDSGLFRE
jgi:hypothetical protein